MINNPAGITPMHSGCAVAYSCPCTPIAFIMIRQTSRKVAGRVREGRQDGARLRSGWTLGSSAY